MAICSATSKDQEEYRETRERWQRTGVILFELFKHPTRATWDWMDDYDQDSRSMAYVINVSNGLRYVLNLGFLTMGIWSVSFSLKPEGTRGGHTGMTGTGNAPEVFNAVADCLRHFVRFMHPKGLMFTGSGSSRQRLYGILAQKMAAELGWIVGTDDLDGTIMYTINQPRT